MRYKRSSRIARHFVSPTFGRLRRKVSFSTATPVFANRHPKWYFRSEGQAVRRAALTLIVISSIVVFMLMSYAFASGGCFHQARSQNSSQCLGIRFAILAPEQRHTRNQKQVSTGLGTRLLRLLRARAGRCGCPVPEGALSLKGRLRPEPKQYGI
jgi:hypothetical protein